MRIKEIGEGALITEGQFRLKRGHQLIAGFFLIRSRLPLPQWIGKDIIKALGKLRADLVPCVVEQNALFDDRSRFCALCVSFYSEKGVIPAAVVGLFLNEFPNYPKSIVSP